MQISSIDVNTICSFLNNAPRPEIKLVVAENDNRSIGIYGNRRTSQAVASAVFRFDLQGASLEKSVQSLPPQSTTPKISLKSKGKSKAKNGSNSVGHVNAVAELRQNSASYSLKMSPSLSGELTATQLRKERSLNIK